ncbi:MAG TPA: hypothetical protein VIY47_09650 [Ignavibacteriaceae bacterium]
MPVRLKPITETSWLVLGDTDETRVGLLTEIREQYVLMAQGAKKSFLSRKEVNKYFEEDVFQNVVDATLVSEVQKDYFINGYPVDFDNPNEVIIKGNKLPLFSKKSTSEVYYSAGYYCLHFPKNWMPAYCPKLSTLETYEFAGPFKSEMEMRSNLVNLRKEKNTKK